MREYRVQCNLFAMPDSDFTFTVNVTDEGPRLGQIFRQAKDIIETPAYMAQTVGGSLLNVTSDLAQELDLDFALVSLCEITDALKTEHPRSCLALPERTMVVLSAGNSSNTVASDRGLTMETTDGRIEITPDVLRSGARALKPNLLIAICDDAPSDSGSRRTNKAVVRNSRWLEECSEPGIALLAGSAQGIVGTVGTDGTAGTAGTVGFLAGGFTDDSAISSSSTPSQAPAHSLRVGLVSTPCECLLGVSRGLDVIGCDYPLLLTANGQALALPLNYAASGVASSEQVLNLRDASMQRDLSPLVNGCQCHACRHHSRAYIHHLIIAHEMLADVLLQIHNTSQMIDFFVAIREHLKSGTFEQFRRSITG